MAKLNAMADLDGKSVAEVAAASLGIVEYGACARENPHARRGRERHSLFPSMRRGEV